MIDYFAMGRNVRRLRKARGISQDELAECVGISVSFMGHIERGTRKMSVTTLYCICRSLSCSADEIMGTGNRPARANAQRLLEMAVEMAQSGGGESPND
jgi:transcriptional regulator with XRE-family HTH domain